MSNLIRCPVCGKLVSTGASQCPKCGEPVANFPTLIEEKRAKARKRRPWRIAFAIIASLALSYCIVRQDSPEKIARQSCGDEFDAYYTAKDAIKNRLKAPSTATFASLQNSVARQERCGVWVVRTYVDAQNSFGATVRAHWLVKVEKTGKRDIDWKAVEMTSVPN